MLKKLQIFYRQAVAAAKVASVCDRDSQVGNPAIILVYVWSHSGCPL